MSFMFKPYPYLDPRAVNRPELPETLTREAVAGNVAVAAKLLESLDGVLGLDGYVSADFTELVARLTDAAGKQPVTIINVSDAYKSSAELDEMLADAMPMDREIDPILIFGKLIPCKIEDFFDPQKTAALNKRLLDAKKAGGIVLLVGEGSACSLFRKNLGRAAFLDLTPLTVTLRVQAHRARCLGDAEKRTKAYIFRRFYYCDYEAMMLHRKNLLDTRAIDFYIDGNEETSLKMLPVETLWKIFDFQVCYPFRCTPVYLEGVWGGFFTKKFRNLPDDMRNAAWIFDMIPNEVSVQIRIGAHTMNFPFSTFFKAEGKNLMGEESVKRFGYIFPIRFNYDDTYGGSGNMSIQVHPPLAYNNAHFSEPFQQDESYYVVKTAGSKTYLGLQDDCNVEEFYQCVKRAEKEHIAFDHDKYVNSFPSEQGDQFLIPGGTIHSSGRNQVVLEIGSYTVGSYTFKLYDYLRKDLDGVPRPIHSIHGENVLVTERRRSAIDGVLRQKPRTVREGEGWKEEIVGEHDLIYFTLHRLCFDRSISDDTKGKFHVLVLVEGDEVLVCSKSDPTRFYHQKHMDMVVIPASMGEYEILNLGKVPCKLTKTMLK